MSNQDLTPKTGAELEPGGDTGGRKHGLSRRDFLKVAAATGAAAASGLALPVVAAPKPKFDTPTLTCVGETQHTIFLQVCAGPSGAPAGFSVQWVRHSDFPALTCGASDEGSLWPPSDSGLICKASFSGSPGCSIYNLAPNACVVVEIGNLNDSECGVGLTNCGADELECGTEYVFRAFAHANSQRQRSDFTPNHCCSTEPCVEGCVRTQGYWKNHPEAWPDLTGQCDCTGGDGLCLGSNCYDQAALLANLGMPAQGNALRILSHQLIAAKLNILSGADGSPVAATIATADGLIGSLNVNSDTVAPSSSLGQQMVAAAHTLDLYNNGDGGVPHCP